MNPEQRKQKEDELEQLRAAADDSHQAAADKPGDEAAEQAAATAEETYNTLKAELDATPPASDEDGGGTDIDFEKELNDLEGTDPVDPPPARTELEKAQRALFFNAQRVKELGGDPTKVVAPTAPPADPPPTPREPVNDLYATKDDLAEQEAAKLAHSEPMRKVLMWHYKHSIQKTGNIIADIENAFFIANKGRIKRSIDEIRRAGTARPSPGSGPGQRPPAAAPRVPQLSAGEQAILRRRGFTAQADGSWLSKKYVTKFVTGKGWVTEVKK